MLAVGEPQPAPSTSRDLTVNSTLAAALRRHMQTAACPDYLRAAATSWLTTQP